MFDQVIKKYLPEITLMDAKVQKTLKTKAGYILHPGKLPQQKAERCWPALICLLAAEAGKGVTTKVIHLAGNFYIMNLATYLHSALPEQRGESFQDDVQYPVLLIDLLYSRIYLDLCKNDLYTYLKDFTVLIGEIHEESLLKDICEKGARPATTHLLNIYGMMGETAAYCGAHAVLSNNYLTQIIMNLGYQLGVLQGIMLQRINVTACLANWEMAWSLLDYLPESTGKDLLRGLLFSYGTALELQVPVTLTKIKA